MKKQQRESLRARLYHDMVLPESQLLLRLRTFHNSMCLRVWNDLNRKRTAGPDVTRTAPSSPAPAARVGRTKRMTSAQRRHIVESSRPMADHIDDVYRRACADAASDLRALGISPTDLMIHAYQLNIGTWEPIVDLDQARLERAFEGVTNEVDPTLRRYLPVPESRALPNGDTRTPVFPDSQFALWRAGLLRICSASLIHASAIGWRKTYVLLSRARPLPSRDIFFGTYFSHVQDRISDAEVINTQINELILGFSAAEASTWHLETLRWQLEEVDLILNPRESYLSCRSEPKKLGIWREIDHWLRKCFSADVAQLSRSESIAAAIMTYAGQPLFEPAPVRTFAQNIVEKWRLRSRSDEDDLKKSAELEGDRMRRLRAFKARQHRRSKATRGTA